MRIYSILYIHRTTRQLFCTNSASCCEHFHNKLCNCKSTQRQKVRRQMKFPSKNKFEKLSFFSIRWLLSTVRTYLTKSRKSRDLRNNPVFSARITAIKVFIRRKRDVILFSCPNRANASEGRRRNPFGLLN